MPFMSGVLRLDFDSLPSPICGFCGCEIDDPERKYPALDDGPFGREPPEHRRFGPLPALRYKRHRPLAAVLGDADGPDHRCPGD